MKEKVPNLRLDMSYENDSAIYKRIFDAISASKHIKSLVFIGECLYNKTEALNLVIDRLKRNTSITEITLEHPTTDEIAIKFGELLESNKFITVLNLDGVYSERKIKMAAEATDHTLTNNNQSADELFITDKGAISIAKALKSNPDRILNTLNLCNNNIDDDGVIAIAQAVTNNQIRNLNLLNNDFDDRGINAITESLKTNTSLESLNLGLGNYEDAKIKLVEAVLSNEKRMKKISILDLSPEQQSTIDKHIESRKGFASRILDARQSAASSTIAV